MRHWFQSKGALSYIYSGTHLICQDGKSSLHAISGTVLRGTRQPFRIVADLSLERVDVGDDLFGTDNILRDVDDGLGAGQSTAAEQERTWLIKHTIIE